MLLWGLPQRAEAVTWNNSTVSGATGNQFNVVVTDVTNSTFIAGDANGNVYVSNDFGITFTRQADLTGANAINDLAYSAAEGVTIAVRANGSIWTNTELILPADPNNPGTVGWTETLTTGTNTDPLNAVTFDGTNAVAVGNNGVLFYSTDKGQTWTAGSTSSGYAQNLNDVSLSGTASIAVGERDGMQDYDNIFYSSGFGGTWNLATIPAPGGMDDAANFEVIDYNGTYAIAGSAKNMDEGTTVIFRSTDNGVNWTKVNFGDDETVRDVRISGTTAILVTEKQMGDDEIWRSTDSGVNWTGVGGPDEGLFAVTLVGTKSYAVGDMGEAGESTDTGATWDFTAATGTGDLLDVEYNTLGDRVVA
ncbi:MAG: hypothetical protein ACPGRY_06215, partial [Candidatus Latescibacterota bacterium]